MKLKRHCITAQCNGSVSTYLQLGKSGVQPTNLPFLEEKKEL